MSQAKTLNEQEIKKVLDYVSTRKYARRDKALILTSHLSGMRVGEISSLTVGHVLDANGNIKSEIRLTAEQTKGKHPRTVFISTKLKDELTNYIQLIRTDDKERTLFPTQKNPRKGFTANTLTHIVNGIYKKAGISGASSHSGKRTGLTNLSERGVGVRTLMAIAGHSHMSSTQKYLDLRPSVIRAAVELV